MARRAPGAGDADSQRWFCSLLVAEISADVSQDHGVWRHPLRYERLRLDATDADVPPFGETQ
nr:hypothetical protein OG491_35075 [Streptomyces sp. NBC_01175]